MMEVKSGNSSYVLAYIPKKKKKKKHTQKQSFADSQMLFLINFIKKETPTQVFSCEFYEIFNDLFFMEHL